MKSDEWTVQQKFVVTHKNGSVLYFDDSMEVDMFLEGIDRGRSARVNAEYDKRLFDCVCVTKDDTHSAACARHNSLRNWQRPRQSMSRELQDSMEYPANKPKRHPDYDYCQCPDSLTHRAAVRTADLANQANGVDWDDI